MKYNLINNQLTTDSLIETIFENRGIKKENIQHYLNVSAADVFPDEMLSNIKDGALMLLKHIKERNRIYIQVDCDADGYCSAALLINYLHSLFPWFTEHFIDYGIHYAKDHGIDVNCIPDGTKLVIAPDSSSNEADIHQDLSKRGIDVLILDHHIVKEPSPYACTINNQICSYPNKSLCGVAITYKFCHFIDSLINSTLSDNYLDLVAVGLCGDMMSITNYETVYYIREGLKNIQNIFLKTAVKVQDFSIKKHGYLDPFAVSFYIVPLINATIRVGSMTEKIKLFEAMLDYKANKIVPSTKRGAAGTYETLSEQAVRMSKNIKSSQDKRRDASLDEISKIIEETHDINVDKILVVQLPQSFSADSTLIGLMANQIRAKYQRPTMLLREVDDDVLGKIWTGSARGYEFSSIQNFMEFLEESGLVIGAEGHPQAFGTWLKEENIPALKAYANEKLKNDKVGDVIYQVDKIYQSNTIKPEEVLKVAELEQYWGKDFDKPFLAIENVNIHNHNIELLSPNEHPTIKIILPSGVELIKFKASQKEFDSLYSESGSVTINVVGKCTINNYGGRITAQIILEDYEVERKSEYYF